MALQISSTLSSNAVMKDGSVVWTGVDDHGGHKIINVDFSEVTNIPASAIVGNVGISFTNVPQLGDLGMGVYTNKPQ